MLVTIRGQSVNQPFIYLFNRFHHDQNAKIRLGRRNKFEEIIRTRDEGAEHTT